MRRYTGDGPEGIIALIINGEEVSFRLDVERDLIHHCPTMMLAFAGKHWECLFANQPAENARRQRGEDYSQLIPTAYRDLMDGLDCQIQKNGKAEPVTRILEVGSRFMVVTLLARLVETINRDETLLRQKQRSAKGQAKKITIIYGYCSDITDQVKEKETLQQLAQTDELTGLWRYHGYAGSLINSEIRTFHSQNSSEYALLHIDLWKFKAVNEQLGHPGGDKVLQRLAMAMQAAARAQDLCCRSSGDQFVVFMRGFRNAPNEEALRLEIEEQISAFIDKTIAQLRGDPEITNLLKNQKVELGMTVGIACGDSTTATLDEAYRRADVAGRLAKDVARTNNLSVYWSIWSPEMDDPKVLGQAYLA